MTKMNCDVLVVGAGPAGSSAALAAAQQDANVIMIDKRREIGSPVQCAEYVPKMLSNEIPIPRSIIAQEVTGMRTFLPNGRVEETRAPGYIIDRIAFDGMLADRAVEHGASLQLSTRALSRRRDSIVIRNELDDSKAAIHSKVTIGADGPRSVVGTWINSVNTIFVQGLQYQLPLTEPLDMTEVYFHPDIYGGYGWVFPKGDTANVGVGVRVRRGFSNMGHIRTILEDFVQRLVQDEKVKVPGKAGASSVTRSSNGTENIGSRANRNTPPIQAGLIPVGGPLISHLNNFLLAGDAAGQTDSITGAGISQAVVCGKLAGEYAARFSIDEDENCLPEYERAWQSRYGTSLMRAVTKRRLMEANWESLDSIIPHCWPAFREYYRDEFDPQSSSLNRFHTGDIHALKDEARSIHTQRSGNKITFYHPGMISYQGRHGQYQAVSITGGACALNCDHCRSKLLQPMIPATTPEALIEQCQKLDAKDDIGCLLSGGSDRYGKLPWDRFLPAIKEIKETTKLFLSVHSGNLDLETALGLKEAGVDQALIDIIAEDETIRHVYHADYGVSDIQRSLEALTTAGLPIVPHIIVGLNEWRLFGELRALSMLETLDPTPQAIVVVSFMPIPDTPMEHTQPPGYRDIARIISSVRIRMPNIPVFLGCARDRSQKEIDSLALQCGVNGIVLPSEDAQHLAEEMRLEIKWKRTCCSVPFLPEDE